jgi:hypothetical protein
MYNMMEDMIKTIHEEFFIRGNEPFEKPKLFLMEPLREKQ